MAEHLLLAHSRAACVRPLSRVELAISRRLSCGARIFEIMSCSLTIAPDVHPSGTSSTPRPASAPCKHHAHPELSRVRAGTTEDDRHSVWTAFAAATRPSVDFFALERAFSSWLFTHVDAERLSRTSADHRGTGRYVSEVRGKKYQTFEFYATSMHTANLSAGDGLTEARLSFVSKLPAASAHTL